MSHYAHQNLSLVTQINVQNAFRAMAFLAETSVFAYLGMAIFSFQHRLVPSFLIWTIILILMGRALNIYPLSWFLNHFRETRISRKMQFVMWFSGLRGAIAYAVSLHLDIADSDQRRTIITTSLCVVLFTILVLGGSTYPLVKWMKVSRFEIFHVLQATIRMTCFSDILASFFNYCRNYSRVHLKKIAQNSLK